MANGKKSKKKLFIFGGLGLLLIVVVILVIISGSKEDIISVQTEKVEKRTITQIVSATGTINPVYKVTISAEATGEIVSLPIKEGDYVKKGQVLVKIRPDNYEAQKNRAAAGLDQARSSLDVTKAQLDKVEADYKRTQDLAKKNLASTSDLETAKSNYLQTLGNLEAQKSMIVQAEASLRDAVVNLEKTTIFAPMDGVVTKLNIDLGQRVLGSGYSPGTEVLTVSDLREIEATVDVDENDVVMIVKGDTAKIHIDAFRDRTFKGTVRQIGNSAVTKGAGTQDEVVNFEVKILLIDPDDSIRPGMSCDANIETQTKLNVLSIPIQSVTARVDKSKQSATTTSNDASDAVQQQKNKIAKVNNRPKEVVFLVKDGKAKMAEVKTGISDDTYIEIESGLNGTEDIISGPYRAISKDLEDGSKITIQPKHSGSDKPKS